MKFLKKHGIQIILLSGIGILIFRLFFTVNRPYQVQNPIIVISREQGSGSRTAFEELIGINTNRQNVMTLNAVIHAGNGCITTAIINNPATIGYVSLSTLYAHQDYLKGIAINGIFPTAENILSGKYLLVRPFSIIYLPENLSGIEQAFIAFATSNTGLSVLETAGVVVDHTNAVAFNATAFGHLSGAVTFGGSTSTEATAMALINEFTTLFPTVDITYMAVGSAAGIAGVIDGFYSLGFSSRAITALEKATGLDSFNYAVDGLVVVVNPQNSIDSLTIRQLQAIFRGDIISWEH